MIFVIGLIVTVFLIFTLVFFHELGHFRMAKRVGIRVDRFSFGFGPRLWGFDYKGTDFCICLFPLGGFVEIHGMNKLEKGEDPKVWKGYDVVPHEYDGHDAYCNKTFWQRFKVLIGGVTINLIMAFFFFCGKYWVGADIHTNEVKPTKHAVAYFKPGDRITQVNSTPTVDFEDINLELRKAKGKPVKVKVKRGKQTFYLTLVPKKMGKKLDYGFEPVGKTYRYQPGFFKSMWYAAVDTAGFPILFSYGLYQLFTGQVNASEGVAGPVGIVYIGAKVFENGAYRFFNFCGIICIALFFFNLLPIPPVDGWHITMLGLEKIRGKPLRFRHEVIINKLGLVFIGLIMLLALYNDIVRMVTGTFNIF